MRILLLIAALAVPLGANSFCRADERAVATPLNQAIAAFNLQAAKDSIGKSQPPLTLDEVVAAIMLAEPKDFPEAPPATFDHFKQIARTLELPPSGEFELLTGIDPGGDYLFDIWSVRIRLPKPDGGSYAFVIRNRIIRAQPVGEAAAELEKTIKEIRPMPGTYRLNERLAQLKARAAAAAKHKP